MLKSNLISLCEKLRLNTSILNKSLAFCKKIKRQNLSSVTFTTNQLFLFNSNIYTKQRQLIFFNNCSNVDFDYWWCAGNLNRIVSNNFLKTYFNYFVRVALNTLSVTKMKDLLNKTTLAENDVMILEQKHNYTNGISNGSKNNSIQKMAKIISGTAISKEIRTEIKQQVDEWISNGNRAPHLTAVLIGDDPASHTYVNNKIRAAAEVGISSETKRLPISITELELLCLIRELNIDDQVDGILIQLPLPGHINERVICDAVSCNKDVDGFNEKNVGRLCLDIDSLIPCTAIGVQELIKRSNIETFGKNTVVIGRSKNVGLPIFMLMHADGRHETAAMDSTVTMCHRFTPPDQLKVFCQNADIIISATGVPGLIKADMVKSGACVIDVGITRITNDLTGHTKLVGDVDYDEVRKVAGSITPVPGGVGPMTVTMLMKNTFIAAKNLAKLREIRNGISHTPI